MSRDTYRIYHASRIMCFSMYHVSYFMRSVQCRPIDIVPLRGHVPAIDTNSLVPFNTAVTVACGSSLVLLE